MSKAQDVSSQLWSMANELRGTMDASEYRNYILGFMFYRYLSEKQEKYLIDNDIFDQVEGKSINDLYRQDAVGDDLKDYLEDISGALGYAIAPEDTWTTLMEKSMTAKQMPKIFKIFLIILKKTRSLIHLPKRTFVGFLLMSI